MPVFIHIYVQATFRFSMINNCLFCWVHEQKSALTFGPRAIEFDTPALGQQSMTDFVVVSLSDL